MRGLAVAGLLIAGLAAAGCGPGSDAGSDSASAEDKREAAELKLSQCLREQGVEVPDRPRAGAGPVRVQLSAGDRKKLEAAMQGPCKRYQAAAFGNVTPEQREEFRDAFTKFAACMRRHGVDLPDPPADGGERRAPAGARRVDEDDPETKAAMTACRDKLPRSGPGIRLGAGSGPR